MHAASRGLRQREDGDNREGGRQVEAQIPSASLDDGRAAEERREAVARHVR